MSFISLLQKLPEGAFYKTQPSFSVDWFSYHIDNWNQWLSKFKDKPALQFLEIGCFEGRSTRWLLENVLTHPTSRIYCIDCFDQKNPAMTAIKERFDHNIKPYQNKISVFTRYSQETLRSDPSFFSPAFFDCIYIDGSHEACDVLEDAVLSFRLLKKEGLLIFDDYELPLYKNPKRNPKTAIDAWLTCFEEQYELLYKGFQVCVVKK